MLGKTLDGKLEEVIAFIGLTFFLTVFPLGFFIWTRQWLSLVLGIWCYLAGLLIGFVYGSDRKEEKLRNEWLQFGEIESWKRLPR